MHNLSTVLRFEFVRTIKKPTFWISILALPLLIAAFGGIAYYSAEKSEEAADKVDKTFSIAIKDKSGLISDQALKQVGAKRIDTKQAGIEAVKSGDTTAFFYYPSKPAKQSVEIYAEDVGLAKNPRYGQVAQSLLGQAAAQKAGSPEVVALLSQEADVDTTTYKNGEQTPGLLRVVGPGIFLVLLYFSLVMLSGQMLTSTTEEKENRVTEMILTTIKSQTLIVGKILAILAVGLLQAAVILIPLVVGYLYFGSQLNIPEVDISKIQLELTPMLLGAVIFAASFMLFTGLLVAIGAAVPTAKEANQFLGFVFVLLFVPPAYAGPVIVTDPSQLIVQIFSYFPLTAPITLLLRNAVGNLGPVEATIGVGVLVISSIIAVTIAIRIFRFGAIEYSRRIDVKTLFNPKA